jgi:hypothetical protein
MNSGIPTAVIVFAEDPSIRRFAEQANNIVRWTDIDNGGHFAALEQPDQLITDLRAFTTELSRKTEVRLLPPRRQSAPRPSCGETSGAI